MEIGPFRVTRETRSTAYPATPSVVRDSLEYISKTHIPSNMPSPPDGNREWRYAVIDITKEGQAWEIQEILVLDQDQQTVLLRCDMKTIGGFRTKRGTKKTYKTLEALERDMRRIVGNRSTLWLRI